MVTLYELVSFLDKYLGVDHFQEVDIFVNGLEIEGRPEVRKAVFAVSLTESVVDKAIQENADAIFLHHGILFRSSRGCELPARRITGSLKSKLRKLLEHDISVIAYHLPLDAHPEIGNNVSIARMLGIVQIEWIPEEKSPPIGVVGVYEHEVDIHDVLKLVKSKLNPDAQLLKYGPDRVKRVAIVSGAGADYIRRFRRGEIDLLITGEFREHCEVYAMDEQINVIIAGHYATEIIGVRNLAKLVQDRFGVEVLVVETGQRI